MRLVQRELQRLAVGQVGQAGLLDRGDVNEHVLAAIVADDEAEALLRIEEFDGALAFANDLGRHSATAAATEAAATAAAEATTSTAAKAATAAAIATTAAAEAAAIAEATTAAEAATIAVACASELFTTTEIVALVTAATTAVTLTPSIETHASSNSLVPQNQKPTRWAIGATGQTHRIICTHCAAFTGKMAGLLVIPWLRLASGPWMRLEG